MTIAIREAAACDAATIAAILIASRAGSFPELLDEHDRDADFWTERWRGYLTRGSRAQNSCGDGFALLAREGGRPVGFAGYHHTTRHGADAELQSIYVLPDSQGRGVGTALLRDVAKRLRSDGSCRLCVGYDPRNPYKRFYRKFGAVEVNPHWAIWRDLNPLLAPL